jgi:hypothetical protein
MGEIGTAFGGVPAPDPLAQFLGRVLAWSATDPLDSYVNIHGFTPKEHVAARQFPRKGGGRAYASMVEYGQLQQFLWMLDRDGDEVFFCISTRSAHNGVDKQGNRKASRAKAVNRAVRLKAFVLDLDVKPKGYPSQRAALAAVLPFFDRLGIKPVLVDTGYGLHAYVTLDQPITPDRWQPLSNALIEAARQGGLKFDVAVTRDDDRILRLPTSFNRKDTANPKICRLLALGADTSLAHLEQVLAPYSGISRSMNEAPRANGHAPKVDLSFLPPRPPITRGPDVDRVRAERDRLRVVTSVDLLLGACPVVVDSDWRGGNGDREPLWFELAKLCHYVEDGRDFFHDLSQDDPRYDEDQTDEKYDQAEPQGWPACATIEAASEDAARICRTCPHYGEGKSPINFATRGDPPGEAYGGQVNGHVNGSALSAAFQTAGGPPSVPIWVPQGYRLDKDNYLWTPEEQKAFTVPIYHVNAVYEDGRKMVEFIFDQGTGDAPAPTGHCFIEASTTASRAKFAEAGNGYGLHVNQMLKERHVAVDLLTQIHESRTAQTYQRCGWTDEGFAFGGTVYTKDGPRPTSSKQADIGPRGTLDAWKASVDPLIGIGLTDMEVFIASAFAAPLTVFTLVKGNLLFTHSAKGGRGKSTAMDVAASVWYPNSYVVRIGTANFVMSRVAMLNNLPFYFDELQVTNKEARVFADLIKAISAGTEPGRLTRGSKEMPQRLSRTMMGANANVSLVEIARLPDTDAQALRVIEYEMSDAFNAVPKDFGVVAQRKEQMEENCGTAGAVYAEFLGRHRDTIDKIVKDQLTYWQRRMGTPDDERFWVASAATLVVGATIAKKLGLIDFDLVAMRRWLDNWFQNQRVEVADMATNASDPEVQLQRVRDFVNDNVRKTIITKHMQRGRALTPAENGADLHGVNEFATRHAYEDKKLWVSEPKIELWCKQIMRQYSCRQMGRVLTKNSLCKRIRDGRHLGAGTGFKTAKEIVWEFDLSSPRLQSFFQLDAEEAT